MADVLRALADRAAIQDLVTRYFLACDRRDFETVTACFTDDAELDYGVFRGDREHVVACITRGLTFFLHTMHFGGNILVTLDGDDDARCESYAVCYHRVASGDGFVDRVCALHYRDVLVRRDGAWAIRTRDVTFVWERLDAVTLPPSPR
ncbi:MAG TPA: nuclear transport factor 2 family protein [Candidatus Binatia bacterium]|jgi:hypothetical protein|nr:nuclear transport factor 2 family protein [Candidatus Binatia bacterium]